METEKTQKCFRFFSKISSVYLTDGIARSEEPKRTDNSGDRTEMKTVGKIQNGFGKTDGNREKDVESLGFVRNARTTDGTGDLDVRRDGL